MVSVGGKGTTFKTECLKRSLNLAAVISDLYTTKLTCKVSGGQSDWGCSPIHSGEPLWRDLLLCQARPKKPADEFDSSLVPVVAPLPDTWE